MRKSGAKFRGKPRNAIHANLLKERSISTLKVLLAPRAADPTQNYRARARSDVLKGYQAIQDLASDKGIEAEYFVVLQDIANLTHALCELGLGQEHLETASIAISAFETLLKQAPAKEGRCYRGNAATVQIISQLVEIHDGQLFSDDCTDQILQLAEAEVQRRIANERLRRMPEIERAVLASIAPTNA